ncbi:hypothetical protein U8591_06475 [Aquirufa antheringensis]
MKTSNLLFTLIFFLGSFIVSAQEYKVVTIVESIVPMGLGRSRIIESQGKVDVEALTTTRDGNKSNSGDVDRDEIKESGENLKETKLVNFYSLVGINFGNIASNDAVIAGKINSVVKQGWSVAFITSGVESDAGKDDKKGLFITRIFFVKK